jgi:hypothetical protein
MSKTFPGAPIDFYTLDGWSNMQLLVQALVKAGPRLTRPSFLAAIKTITSFDADGLVAPSDPASKQGTACYAIVQFDGANWNRVIPTKPGAYQCS